MAFTLWKSPYKINVRDQALNPGGTNLQYDSWITAMPDAGFLIKWSDDSNSTALGSPDISGRNFSADGTPSSGENLVSFLFFDGQQQHGQVANLGGGKFVSVYQTEDQAFFTTGENVCYEIYDTATFNSVFRGNGDANDPASTSGIFQLDNETDPSVTSLAGGGFFVAYVDDSSGNADIRGFIVNSPNAEQASFMIDSGAAASSAPVVTTLTNGKVVVVSQYSSGPANIHLSIVGATGVVEFSDIIQAGISDLTAPAVAALTSGGFAVTWVEADANGVGDAGVLCVIYSAAGVVRTAFIANQVGTAGVQSAPTIAGLKDGSLVIAWIDGPSGDVMAQQYSVNGVALTSEFTMASLVNGADPHLVTLSDGRVALSVTDTDAGGNSDVFAAIWDPRRSIFDGTNQSDTIMARVNGGTINGLNGDDKLTGLDGIDSLKGGNGSDTLIGGKGSDYLDGGADNDVLTGGDGNDSYYVDSQADVINETVGGGVGDTVYASVSFSLAADDNIEFLLANGAAGVSLTGNALNNTIRGGAGGDVLTGGLGVDTLKGGGGADVFNYDLVNESAFGSVPDQIVDFVVGQDKIDLHDIDANGSTVANDDFSFIGTAGFTGLGQIRAVQSGARTYIYVNASGDKAAEMILRLDNVIAANLHDTDFIL